MAVFNLKSFAIVALATSILLTTAGAARQFNKRSDLENVPPVSESSYAVPLEAGANTLPAPASDKSLEMLTIARGLMTFDCTDSAPSDEPGYISENVELIDVAPLIQYFPSEETLHELVRKFYEYDYTELKNSSLICIGTIYTQFGETTVNLDGYQPFAIQVNAAIGAPNENDLDGYWDLSVSFDKAWEVYRVETTGGAIPPTCSDQNSTFQIPYSAEYWFYHA